MVVLVLVLIMPFFSFTNVGGEFYDCGGGFVAVTSVGTLGTWAWAPKWT